MKDGLVNFTCEDCGCEWEDYPWSEQSCPECGSENISDMEET